MGSSEVLLTVTRQTPHLKTCGSMVDSSLVLFSMFGLFAMHQEGFIIVIILFFTFIPFFFVRGRWYIKSVYYWRCDDGESRFFIGTVCVCSSHDSLLLSGGICLDVI